MAAKGRWGGVKVGDIAGPEWIEGVQMAMKGRWGGVQVGDITRSGLSSMRPAESTPQGYEC